MTSSKCSVCAYVFNVCAEAFFCNCILLTHVCYIVCFDRPLIFILYAAISDKKKLCLKGRVNLRAARYPLHPSGKTHVKGTLLLGNCQVVDVAKDFTWLFFQRISKDFFAGMSPKTHRLPFL